MRQPSDDGLDGPKKQEGAAIAMAVVVLIILGGIDAWAGRQSYFAGDTTSYISMARNIVTSGWSEAINGYWSPAYPAYLSLFIRPFIHDSYQEFAATRTANFLIYLVTLFVFHRFLSRLYEFAAHRTDDSGGFPRAAFFLSGYAIFFWACFSLNLVCRMSPDEAVMAVVLLAATLLLGFRQGRIGPWRFVWFGVLLGLGYWVKAILFAVSLICLLAVLLIPDVRAVWRRYLLSLLSFGLVATPLVLAVSLHCGRLTIGETGRLNYVWRIEGLSDAIHLMKVEPRFGTLQHPTREVMTNPPVFEFAGPLQAPYPPWYEPSYWYAGVKTVFEPHEFLRGLVRNGRVLGGELRRSWVPPVLLGIALYGLFLRWRRGRKATSVDFVAPFPELWLLATASVAVYLLVVVETRYVSGSLCLMGLLIVASVHGLGRHRSHAGWVVTVLLVAAAAISPGPRLIEAARSVIAGRGAVWNDRWAVMREFQRLGVEAGTPVASIGLVRMNDWPLLAKVRVVVESPDYFLASPEKGPAESYWDVSPELQEQVMQLFRRAGAKLVVAFPVPKHARLDDWTRIAGTDYYYRRL